MSRRTRAQYIVDRCAMRGALAVFVGASGRMAVVDPESDRCEVMLDDRDTLCVGVYDEDAVVADIDEDFAWLGLGRYA